jgi:nucleoside-diphosphate-sugar epimerase
VTPPSVREHAARVLVAGAGEVGTGVALALHRRGEEVAALRRQPALVPGGIEAIGADLTRIETLRHLPQGLDALVFCAAADRRDEQAYRAVYVDGLRNLLDAVGPVRRVVFTSTTGVYGQRDGSWVDEGSPTEPSTFTGAVMLEAELLVRTAAPLATSLRFGGIYGPGRGRLIDEVRRGEAVDHDGPPVYTNRIHVEDAIGAVLHVLDRPAPPGVLNVVDDDPAPRGEVLRWLAARLGAPDPPGESRAQRVRADNKRVANTALHALGFELRYPTFREGYGPLLA